MLAKPCHYLYLSNIYLVFQPKTVSVQPANYTLQIFWILLAVFLITRQMYGVLLESAHSLYTIQMLSLYTIYFYGMINMKDFIKSIVAINESGPMI